MGSRGPNRCSSLLSMFDSHSLCLINILVILSTRAVGHVTRHVKLYNNEKHCSV